MKYDAFIKKKKNTGLRAVLEYCSISYVLISVVMSSCSFESELLFFLQVQTGFRSEHVSNKGLTMTVCSV